MKRISSLVFILLLVVFSSSTVFGLSFSDVNEGDWFYEDVMSATNQGYISGYEDGTFKPDKDVSHGEFYAMLCRAAGVDLSKGANGSHWAYIYATTLYYQGNSDIQCYGLDSVIDRKHCIRDLLYVLGVKSSVGLEYYESVPFSDLEQIGNPFICYDGYIIDAYKLGLIKGYSDGTVRPDSSITRAEAVALIERALSLKEDAFDLLGPSLLEGLSIEYQGDVSYGFYPDVVAAVSKFPRSIIDEFIKDGGKFIITNENPSVIYGSPISVGATGMYDAETIEIYGFNDNRKHSFAFILTDSLVHELGHYMYFEVLSDKDRQEISRIYNEGLEVEELKNLLEDPYCASSEYEFFAELVQSEIYGDNLDDSILVNSRGVLSKYLGV